jgi:hypothetical protein
MNYVGPFQDYIDDTRMSVVVRVVVHHRDVNLHTFTHTHRGTHPSEFVFVFIFEMETHIFTSLFGFIFKFEKGILVVLTDLKTFSVRGQVYRGGGDTFGKQKLIPKN